MCWCRISGFVRYQWWSVFFGDLFRVLALYLSVSQDYFEDQGVEAALLGYGRFETALFETAHL